jgi:hypothetical protein
MLAIPNLAQIKLDGGAVDAVEKEQVAMYEVHDCKNLWNIVTGILSVDNIPADLKGLIFLGINV